MDIKIDYSEKRKDDRGFLVDFLKNDEVEEKDKNLGQIYFVTFRNKGVIRGEHYHKYKSEWFVVVEGKVKIILIDVANRQKRELILNGDRNKYRRLRVGPNIWHKFVCLSDKAAMINYSNKAYSEKKSDTWRM